MSETEQHRRQALMRTINQLRVSDDPKDVEKCKRLREELKQIDDSPSSFRDRITHDPASQKEALEGAAEKK